MKISGLDGRRVALWGWGREGRAAYAAIRSRLPRLPLTLLCSAEEAAAVQAIGDPALAVETAVDAQRLQAFEFVVKSPGISPYTSPAADAALAGVRFIGGTALWFAEHPEARTLCVTGTKGKSTATALVAHLLRAGGHRTALAGNIGLPLLDLIDPGTPPDYWAIELSSFQTREASLPDVAVVLNLFPEHLDWHGSQARYYEDKLALLVEASPGRALINGADARLKTLRLPGEAIAFNVPGGWHLEEGWVMRGASRVIELRRLPLRGQHNGVNLCAALAAVEALDLDAAALVPSVATFQPLPHRLQTVGFDGGVELVNDSIATTPHATIAALDCFRGRRVALIVGGYDRGVDWGVFYERAGREPPAAIVTMGQNGPRIHEKLRALDGQQRFSLSEAGDMDEAVAAARRAVGTDGVLLLSPGAPSFPRYRDYTERGAHFARACGLPAEVTAIQGLGIA